MADRKLWVVGASPALELALDALEELETPVRVIPTLDQARSALEGGDVGSAVLMDAEAGMERALELTRAVRRSPGMADVPVVVWGMQEVDVRGAYDAGANSVVLLDGSTDDPSRLTALIHYWARISEPVGPDTPLAADDDPGHDPSALLSRELRVLIVEDVAADADLMVRTLVRAGLGVTPLVVREEEDFRAALDDFRPDVVLADDKLPRFSGQRALRIVRGSDPFLPVIMVTGTLREDQIIRLMALGLTSYVIKDRMLRLAPEVAHAVDRAKVARQAKLDRQALEASERRFRAVAEASGDALLVFTSSGEVLFLNRAASEMFGYPADGSGELDILRLVPGDLLRPEEAPRGIDRERAGLVAFMEEATALRADGTEFPAEITVSSWEEDGRRLFSAHVRDVTRRKAEARIRQTLAQAVAQAANVVIITDPSGAIEYVNPAFERLSGYTADEILGKNPRILKSDRYDAGFYRGFWARLLEGQTVEVEFTNKRKDGTLYIQKSTLSPLTEEGEVRGFVGIGQDVTEERQLERQFRQAQKMEAVGQLAGGIAHDFNNVLTGILTNAQLQEMSMPPDDVEGREYVADIITAARRGSDLVRHLMSLARSDAGEPREADLVAVVDEAVRTVRRVVPESIEVTVRHETPSLVGIVDDTGLHQALLNLANNAKDAMPDGGTLTIRTGAHPGRGGRTHAHIEVTDTGSGMDPVVMERIFEPFFTTKPRGRGTGLGLAMVSQYATRSGGQILARSEPGKGTTMTLVIPVVGGGAAQETTQEGASRDRSPVQGKVLLAEDQDEIRRVAGKVLERMGYQVLSAANGDDAIRLLEEERDGLALVVADLIMPKGGGGRLFRRAQEWPRRPPFLFMSGYAADELNGDEELLKQVPFISKPWSVREFQDKVSEVTGQR